MTALVTPQPLDLLPPPPPPTPPTPPFPGMAVVGSPSFLTALQPGDVLLYARTSPFNWLIKVKTWSRFTHVEVVTRGPHPAQDQPFAAASRNGHGVAVWPLDYHGLALVLRPAMPFHQDSAYDWYMLNHVYLQKYDWIGLFNFTYARLAGRDNGRMFCSEFATRFLRAGGVDPFPENDADTISPRDFSITPCLTVVWRSPGEWEKYAACVARGEEWQ